MNIELLHTDCMEYMASLPDNAFNLAIVDPPYGIKAFQKNSNNRIDKKGKIKEWDIKPTPEYFNELFRVSEKQIIWGANNFKIPESEYFIIWNKKQTVDNFASAEYAWTNCKVPAKIYDYSIHKTMQDRKEEGGKIHPTQKPVQLYKWLLMNYAKEGDTIFDSHGGSMSLAISAYDLGFDCTICEIDRDYYNAAVKRFNQHKAQLTLKL